MLRPCSPGDSILIEEVKLAEVFAEDDQIADVIFLTKDSGATGAAEQN